MPPPYRLRVKSSIVPPKPSPYLLRSNAKNKPAEQLEWKPARKPAVNNLMHMNDNCLLNIFEFMGPDELCDIALVCKRLYNLAQYYFRLKYRRFSFLSLIDQGRLHVKTADRIFRIFGHQITSLSLMRSLFDGKSSTPAELLLPMKKYCRKNMNELSLDGFEIGVTLMLLLKPLLKRIEILELANCTVVWERNAMKNLKVLRLCDTDASWDHFFPFKAPNLEEVELKNLRDFWDKPLVELSRTNGNIKKLSIVHCSGVTTTAMIAIGKLQHLEQLEFQQYDAQPEELFHKNVNHLCSAKNLKVLKLNCSKKSVSSVIGKFVSSGIALEHLELSNGTFDSGTFENIKKMKTLKVLRFNEMADINDSHILAIAKELKLLTEFYVKSDKQITRFGIKSMLREAVRLACLKIDVPDFTLNLMAYQELLNIIQKRDEHVKLELTIYGHGFQLLVPKEVTTGPNEKWLCVKELDRTCNKIFPYSSTSAGDFDDFDSDDDYEFGEEEEEFINWDDIDFDEDEGDFGAE